MRMRLVLAVCTLLSCSPLLADFVNDGLWQSRRVNLCCNGTLENDGKVIGQESVYLEADSIIGNGLIQASVIEIHVDEFIFTGTISCSQSCTIYTNKPFSQKIFKRVGGGIFSIIYERNSKEP